MAEPFVILKDLVKSYGEKTVLRNFNMSIGEGEMVALLGPSGCGKSTSLKILAGLEQADSGDVIINGREVSGLPTRKRNLGIVFQAYSLFPHMDAVENVAYGLKIRGVDAGARRKRAEELVELVGLNEHAEKYPGQMSGGQQQRVALARALAVEPEVLLLDEPLSALDAKVRVQLRDEIRRIQLQEGIATLMVTHDQEEALVMADRIGVMNEGVIAQIGTPAEIYRHPESPFISSFVGITNRIPGVVGNGRLNVMDVEMDIVNKDMPASDGDIMIALLRPEEFELRHDEQGRFTVHDIQLRGIFSAVMLDHDDYPGQVRVDVSTTKADQIAPGQRVKLDLVRSETVIDTPTDEERTVAQELYAKRPLGTYPTLQAGQPHE
ncbi:ABC transporter ATP-binding protein [Corynebacterium sp. CCUG 70398]|uniref:ABC transporter ATP-binding protein n=1 Tax=Corynebacterium sp. CCUG 70398 TaxID=2823891 RepID=UPI002109F14D|nr:ABC transporter ATP-binding protein [Corynebacterium sp. CCUG 70398]MCQ4622291.1 ABC transporter ATP-binding protein [Corynebacterium sp. CCUG 70398]